MAFDGIVLRQLVTELSDLLLGGRVNKIYQPTKTEVVLTVRNKRQNYPLLISIHPVYTRMHVTDQAFSNPSEPPMFCMVLRKHLQGATIEKIEQEGLERVVKMEFRGRNEIGDEMKKTLMIELMGKHSNVILLNEEQTFITTCLKLVPASQNRFRTLLPGAEYVLPPAQDKLNMLEVAAEDVVKKLDFNRGQVDRQLMGILLGISRPLAQEIVHEAGLGGPDTYLAALDAFKKRLIAGQSDPAIYDCQKEDYHVLPLSHLDCPVRHFDSVSDMLAAFYQNKADRDRVRQVAGDIYRKLKNDLDKLDRKIHIHERTLQKAQQAEKQQKFGELLTAHMHLVKRGDESIEVHDYYDPEQKMIKIPLDSEKTPSENAQHYFKQYRKLIRAQTKAKAELKRAHADQAYIEQVRQQIDHAHDDDLEAIREELIAEGLLKKKETKKKRKKVKPKPDRFVTSDGTPVYVGKNNLQNEYVTHRMASKEHIWLHTLDIPGSHVIIADEDPSDETILEAAEIAAYYSKGRGSASVPVDYTKVKHVKKPSGAKPGFVTYTDQKTVFVTPEEKTILKKRQS